LVNLEYVEVSNGFESLKDAFCSGGLLGLSKKD